MVFKRISVMEDKEKLWKCFKKEMKDEEANAVPALHPVAMLEEKKPLQRALIGQVTNLE